MTTDWSKAPHFPPSEWGEHAKKVHSELVYTMEAIRELAGTAINLHLPIDGNSHATNSWHHKFLAVDCHFSKGLTHTEEFIIISQFPQVGGIGFYPDWYPRPGWHIDLRPYAIRSIWVRINGVYHYGWEQMARALSLCV